VRYNLRPSDQQAFAERQGRAENGALEFKNGVLAITLPKTPQARPEIKRIAINGK
jgi:HSP20 family molecular chaperone IbpA